MTWFTLGFCVGGGTVALMLWLHAATQKVREMDDRLTYWAALNRCEGHLARARARFHSILEGGDRRSASIARKAIKEIDGGTINQKRKDEAHG